MVVLEKCMEGKLKIESILFMAIDVFAQKW